jgi:hypothetical protein
MNLINVIIISLVIWLVYSLIQSYRNLEKELKEIRAKCIGVNALTPPTSVNKPSSTQAATPAPVADIPVTTTQVTEKAPPKTTQSNQGAQGNLGTAVNKPATTGYYSNSQTGAYTSTGDEIYSKSKDDTNVSPLIYDNDPINSLKNNIVGGLNALKMYTSI